MNCSADKRFAKSFFYSHLILVYSGMFFSCSPPYSYTMPFWQTNWAILSPKRLFWQVGNFCARTNLNPTTIRLLHYMNIKKCQTAN